MSDGRLVSLAHRTGVMLLGLSIAACIWPNDDGHSAFTGGIAGYQGWEAKAKAAEGKLEAEQRGYAQEALAGEAATPAAASLTSRELEAAEVTGALERMKETPFAHLELESLESVEVVATGYTAGKESTGKSPGHPQYGITYSGVKVRKDEFSTIAADPRVFPIGTIMYIPGYGFGVVADTGGAIKGHKIDLYFATKQQVYEQWGKRNVRVYILRKGDGRVTEAMMNSLNGYTKAVPVEKQVNDPANSGQKE